MGKDRRKNKKKKRQMIKPEKQKIKPEKQITNTVANNISKEEMIEIQAEAYYRALKKIEQDRFKAEEQANKEQEKHKIKWHINILWFLNVFLFPWKLHKRFIMKSQMYSGALVLLISFAIKFIGTLMWIFGFYYIISNIAMVKNEIFSFIGILSIGMVAICYGSIFILSGDDFSKETDNNNIYAYSACIIALISCAVSIFALLKN